MHQNLTEVNESTVAGLGRLARFFGFNDVMGRLYGTLLLNPSPLSLDDLVENLHISKGSVSMNMRSLERWGMAKEHWVRGERKKYYMAESDMWKVIRNVLGSREQREVMVALQVLDESVEKLQSNQHEFSEDDAITAEFYLERMEELQCFFRFSQMALAGILGKQDMFEEYEEIAHIEIQS